MIEAGGNRLLIVAKAGQDRRNEEKLLGTVSNLGRRGFDVDLVHTSDAHDAGEVIRRSIGKYHGLGMYGGDGAFRLAAATLAKSGLPSEKLPILFPIRGGSVNLFDKAAANYLPIIGPGRLLEKGRCYDVDIVRASIDGGPGASGQELFFLSNASIGLSARLFNINHRLNGEKGGIEGYLPYVPGVFFDADNFKVDISIEGREKNTIKRLTEMIVLNGGKAGVFPFGPDETYDSRDLLAIMFDGAHEVPQLNAAAVIEGLAYDIFHPGQASSFETRARGRKIKIELKDKKEIYLQVDGDGVGVVRKSIEFDVLPSAIRVMARDQERPGFRRRVFDAIGMQRRVFKQQGQEVKWIP